MRPPSFYSQHSGASAGSGSGSSRSRAEYGASSQQHLLRSSLTSPSSSSYVTRSHLPYVSQTMLVAHCLSASGAKPTLAGFGQQPPATSARLAGAGSHRLAAPTSGVASAGRPRSRKSYQSLPVLQSARLSPISLSAYQTTSARLPPGAAGSSSMSQLSYHKPMRLRDRPLLAQLSSASKYVAGPSYAKRNQAQEALWSSDVARNISRNKYLIKFRELEKHTPARPIQLANRTAPAPPSSAFAGGLARSEARYAVSAGHRANYLRASAPTRESSRNLAPEEDLNSLGGGSEPPATVRGLAASGGPEAAPQSQPAQPAAAPPTKEAPIDLAAAAAAADQLKREGKAEAAATTSGRIRFREYNLDDFDFLSVLGHGGWGFVILAELKGHDAYFAVKCIKKITVVEDDDFDSIMIERKVLSLGNLHPFICKLFCTFQTDGYLFFVMEYCAGGDLMFHVQRDGKFTEARCRFYAAEIICAIRFLHNRHIIYRDLKLDNILLDSLGHIRLVDFGMCQCRSYREEMLPSNFCGTPEYISPEIIKGVPYNHSVDWWSFGVLLYEMAVGKMPFRGGDENELLWNVCYEQIHYPMFLTKELTSLLQQLLEREPSKRMGMATCKAGDIQEQAWFGSTDWRAIEALQVEPPFVPKLNSKRDVQYFDLDFTESEAQLSPVEPKTLERIDQAQFQRFPYTNPQFHS